MACPCCNSGPRCCCDGGVVTVATEGCANTVAALPNATPEKISVVVDWDGLTAVIDEPFITPAHIYYSKGVAGAADFSCFTNFAKANNGEAFDAFERTMQVNLELFGSGSGCWHVTGNINIFFTGTFPSNGFFVLAQTSTISPAPSVCQTTVENQIDLAGQFWCSNPYDSFITTEMIFAP